MPTKLEKLLQEIDPAKTIDKTEKKMARAVASYHRNKNTVDSWEESKECIVDIAEHLYINYFDVNPKNHQRDNHPLEYNLLLEEYGSHQTIYQIMRSDTEGGIYTILKTLARLLVDFYSQNKIRSKVYDYYNNLTADENFAAAKEYIRLNDHILPTDKVTRNMILCHFHKALLEHPYMVKKLRSL